MKIKKMTGYFGTLEGRTLELSGGLDILYAPNESGKSTWCAFLRAMLYGVSTAQRAKAGQQPDKLKYRPWSGAQMSGSMELETKNGPVTLRRWTERANQPMQAFSATVTGTDMPAPGLTADTAGQTLTGVPREVFERSAFIRQSGLEMSNDPELDRRISAIVSTGDEEISYMEASALLRSWQRHRRSGKRGAIPELEAQMEETERTLEDLREDAKAIAAIEDEIAEQENRRQQAVERMQAARSDQRRQTLSDLAEARRRIQEAESCASEAETQLGQAEEALFDTPYGDMGAEEAARRSRTDMDNAEELMRLAGRLPPVKISYIPLILSALAFLLAIVSPWKVACAGVGFVALLLFVVMFTRLQSIAKTKEDTLAQRQRILDAYGVEAPEEIEELLERYRALWKQKERASLRLEEAQAALEKARSEQKDAEARALEGLDFSGGDSEAARAGREVEQIKARIAALREQRAAAEGQARSAGDVMVMESELADQRRRHEALSGQEQAIALALEVMAEADAEMQQRFSPRLAKRAAELFARLTEGRYDEVTLSRDLTAKVRRSQDAVGRELDYLSAGAKDQLYLALRLAVCELALPEEDPCPVVLDDALASFDDRRMALALELLKEISRTRQVLLFTCHDRERQYFAEDHTVTKISLAGDNK